MATIGEMKEWLAPGFAIQVEVPFGDSPNYRAIIAEFGISHSGETTEEAIRKPLEALGEHLIRYRAKDAVLPDRSAWIERVQAERSGQVSA